MLLIELLTNIFRTAATSSVYTVFFPTNTSFTSRMLEPDMIIYEAKVYKSLRILLGKKSIPTDIGSPLKQLRPSPVRKQAIT